MPTIEEIIQDENPQNAIQLYDLDLTSLGGTVLYFTPNVKDDGNSIIWQTNTYIPAPIIVTGFEAKGSPTAPAQPSMSISNIDGFILGSVIEFGDLIGAKLTRWRTFKQFLDGEVDADPNQHLTPDRLIVEQKPTHTNKQITWNLVSSLDKENLFLPKRQILKDESTRNLFAPGVARIRNR